MDSIARKWRLLVAGALVLVLGPVLAEAVEPVDLPSIGSPAAVVARRGEASLTVADIDAKVRSMPPEMRADYLADADRMTRLVDSMLLTKQLAIEAERDGVAQTEAFVGDLELAKTELLSRTQIERHMAAHDLPDIEQLARERYLASAESYRPKPRIDFRHVLISTDGRDEKSAEVMAQEVVARARAGEDFVKLAAEYSKSTDGIDRSLIQDPDFTRLDLNFAAGLKSLEKVGDISAPIRSKFGFHVIRLERLETFEVPSFDELKPKLIDELRKQLESAERARYLATFSQAEVELNGEVIQGLPARYQQLHRATSEPTVKAVD